MHEGGKTNQLTESMKNANTPFLLGENLKKFLQMIII